MVVTREELNNHWSEVKNRLRNNWRELTENELAQFDGSPKQLIAAIQRKTGASWNEIESFLGNVMREVWSATSQASKTAGQYGNDASQFARDGYGQLAALTADYSQKVVSTVKRKPVESLAIAFGVGIVAGTLLLLNRRRS